MSHLKKNKHFYYIFIVVSAFSFLTRSHWQNFKEAPYQFGVDNDINQYYSYLPAAFIHHDLSFNFDGADDYWLNPAPNGNMIPKMTLGMSIMYSPFFAIGHAWAKLGGYKTNGYSFPYSASLRLGTWIYVFLGFLALFKSLKYFFSSQLSAIVLGLLFIGTNLFYYTLGEGEMTHSYVFSLFSGIILFTINWVKTKEGKYLLLLGLLLGMIVLIRPTSIIIGLFPLLYGMSSLIDFKERLILVISNKTYFTLAIVCFISPIFIQLLYWKIYGGSWVIWSYGEEQFYFNAPKIFDFLFSYRKGWFLYTPFALICLLSIPILRKYVKQLNLIIPLIFIGAVYVLSSWWCWWFGGGLGARSMVDFYPLLAFLLAALINYAIDLNSILIKISVGLLIFISVGYAQLVQQKFPGGLHWDSMTKESYWITMGTISDMDEQTNKRYKSALIKPDYEAAKKNQ